jgi:hypothetical protein
MWRERDCARCIGSFIRAREGAGVGGLWVFGRRRGAVQDFHFPLSTFCFPLSAFYFSDQAKSYTTTLMHVRLKIFSTNSTWSGCA